MRVRLFAALREEAGCSMLDSDAPDVRTLLEELAGRFGPRFAQTLSISSVVVDGETVDPDRKLDPGDEVALLPPVSGGS